MEYLLNKISVASFTRNWQKTGDIENVKLLLALNRSELVFSLFRLQKIPFAHSFYILGIPLIFSRFHLHFAASDIILFYYTQMLVFVCGVLKKIIRIPQTLLLIPQNLLLIPQIYFFSNFEQYSVLAICSWNRKQQRS